MRNEPVKVHFNNPICSYCYCICKADSKYKCASIQAQNNDLNDWKKQAQARANHCNYRGLELTATEAETRWINSKKADKCKYLMRLSILKANPA